MSQENRIYIWLIIVLLIAAAYRYFRFIEIRSESEAFLRKKDALFYELKNKSDSIFATIDSAGSKEIQASHAAIKVNINSSNAEALTVIPGIGPKLAERIVKYRIENGLFQNVKELIKVRGIGEKKLAKMREYVVVKSE